MTGPWFLIGAAIGFAAVSIAGYLRCRHIYNRELRQYEPEIPGWVNQGNRAVIGTYNEVLTAIVEAIHFEQWEIDMEDQS